MKSEKRNGVSGEEERKRGNKVKGCEGIPSFFSAVSHSAGARDTKEPVCVSVCVCECVCLIVCLNGATGPRLDNGPRPFAVTPPHQRAGEREGIRGGKDGKEWKERREGERRRGGGEMENEIEGPRRRKCEGSKAPETERGKASAERGGGGGEMALKKKKRTD